MNPGDFLLDEPVSVDHAVRVFPRVEARDLNYQRAINVDPELAADVGCLLCRERHVLRRKRVNRRWHDVDLPLHAIGHVLLHVEHRLRIVGDVLDQVVDRRRVGG